MIVGSEHSGPEKKYMFKCLLAEKKREIQLQIKTQSFFLHNLLRGDIRYIHDAIRIQTTY